MFYKVSLKKPELILVRFTINTTLGIAGIFDVASYYGLSKLDKEDYGQTLGKWGCKRDVILFYQFLGQRR